MKGKTTVQQAATAKLSDANKVKRKFSSFFKSLVIELDKDLYGPDNHLVEVLDINDRGLMECFQQLWWWNWVVDQEIVQKGFLGGGWGWGGDSREVIDKSVQGSTCPDLSLFFIFYGEGGGGVKEDNRQIYPKLHSQIWQINGNKCFLFFYHTEPH